VADKEVMMTVEQSIGPGQPTKYKPEYCEQLIEHMSKGLSFECFGPKIGVNRDTLYEWCKVHSEFSDAKKRAVDACLLWWEQISIDWIVNEKFNSLNSASWIFSMKNRFKWTDKVEVSGDPSGEKPLLLAYKL